MNKRKTRRRRNASVTSGIVSLLTGLLLVAVPIGWAVVTSSRRKDVKKKSPAVEKRRDETLKQTFPASDAPASQYFDIPVNRV